MEEQSILEIKVHIRQKSHLSGTLEQTKVGGT
jgi:hypothetical protein